MEPITNASAKGLKNYFNALRNFGYKSITEVNKLITVLILEEILTHKHFKYYITEEDYKLIDDVLYCIMGTTCLVPYPQYINTNALFLDSYLDAYLRLTLNEDFRFIEDDYNIRVID